jgi:isoleucyl-tRNA synthetase
VKPNFKLLGQKMGKKMKAVQEALASLDQNKISELEQKGSLALMMDGEEITIALGEVEIMSEDIPGWEVASEGSVTVALDVAVTESLREEGVARETVNQIQKLRKELNFNVTDRIDVTLENRPEINYSVLNYKKYICAEILADTLDLLDVVNSDLIIEVNDLPVKIIINRKTPGDGKE